MSEQKCYEIYSVKIDGNGCDYGTLSCEAYGVEKALKHALKKGDPQSGSLAFEDKRFRIQYAKHTFSSEQDRNAAVNFACCVASSQDYDDSKHSSTAWVNAEDVMAATAKPKTKKRKIQ